MKLEVGKYYKTRDGRKVGPMLLWGDIEYPFSDHPISGTSIWKDDGSSTYHRQECTIISEWPSDSPVRTVTRKEIVPGVYGKVSIHHLYTDEGFPLVAISDCDSHKVRTVHVAMTPTELRAAAATLIEIADALEDGKDG